MSQFKVGDRVAKKLGYQFIGTVQAVFQKRNGETCIVVEMDGIGLLHIYDPYDLMPTTVSLEFYVNPCP